MAAGVNTNLVVSITSQTSEAPADTNLTAMMGGATNAAAVLALLAAAPAPPALKASFGSGAATFGLEGNVSVQTSAAGVTPGATGVDSVLAIFSLPAASFDVAGRGVTITAAGSFAANANTKTVKIIVNPSAAVVGSTVGSGGTTICSTGAITTNGAGWQVTGSVFKYGAAGSNTQLGIHNQAQVGAAVASMLAPSLMTATESAAILIAITGNAATTATDIVFNYLEVNATN